MTKKSYEEGNDYIEEQDDSSNSDKSSVEISEDDNDLAKLKYGEKSWRKYFTKEEIEKAYNNISKGIHESECDSSSNMSSDHEEESLCCSFHIKNKIKEKKETLDPYIKPKEKLTQINTIHMNLSIGNIQSYAEKKRNLQRSVMRIVQCGIVRNLIGTKPRILVAQGIPDK